MLRFPIIHKGWIPKKGRTLPISIFWLNKSDMLLEYDKRDIEVMMEFGDIPYEKLDDKNWDWVNQKKKEIEELEEYRKQEKQAYIIPMRTIQTPGQQLDQYFKKTQQFDIENLNKRYQKFQTLMDSFGIFNNIQNQDYQQNLTPMPTGYLNKQEQYEQSLLYLIKQNKLLNYEEIQFLFNANVTSKFNNKDIYQIACNNYFYYNPKQFEQFFKDTAIKDQQLFQKAIDNCNKQNEEQIKFIYALKLFKNNNIDIYYQDKLIKIFNKKQQKGNCFMKLLILKIFHQNNQKIPYQRISLSSLFSFINTNPNQDKNFNRFQNILLLKNDLYKGFILDRILDFDNIYMTQINFYLSINILSCLKNNELFSFYLYQYQQIFGENYLQKNILSNLQTIKKLKMTNKNILTMNKSIEQYYFYSQSSNKPEKWFNEFYFIIDNQKVLICDRLEFHKHDTELNNQRQKIQFYENKQFNKNQKQFDILKEYDYQNKNKFTLKDNNLISFNEENIKINNIELKYKEQFNRYDITINNINNIKAAKTFNSLKGILKNQKFFYSKKFEGLRQKMKNQFDKIAKIYDQAEFNRLLQKMSDPQIQTSIQEFDNQIQEFQFEENKDQNRKLYFLLNFKQQISNQKYIDNLKEILFINKLPQQNQFNITYQSSYGPKNLNLNKYLINQQFYQQYNYDDFQELINKTIQHQTQFLIPVYLSILLYQKNYNYKNLSNLIQLMVSYKQTDWILFLIQYSIKNKLQFSQKDLQIILKYISTIKYYQYDYIQILQQFLWYQKENINTQYFEDRLENLEQQKLEKVYYEFDKNLQEIYKKKQESFENKYIEYVKIFYQICYKKDYLNICQQIIMNIQKLQIVNVDSFLLQYSILAKDLTLQDLLIDDFQKFFELNENKFQFDDLQIRQLFIDYTCNIIENQELPLKIYGQKFIFSIFCKINFRIDNNQVDQIIDSLTKLQDIKQIGFLFASMHQLWYRISQKQFKFAQYLLRNAGQFYQRKKLEQKIQKLFEQNDISMNDENINQQDNKINIDNINDEQDYLGQNYLVKETGLPFSLMLHITKEEIRGTRLEINEKFGHFPKISKKFLKVDPRKLAKRNLIQQTIDEIMDWKLEYNEIRSEQLSDQEILKQEYEKLRKRPYLSKYLIEAMENGKKWEQIYQVDEKIYRRDIHPNFQQFFSEYIEEYNQNEEDNI